MLYMKKRLFKNKVEALYGLLDDAGDDAEGKHYASSSICVTTKDT